MTIFYQAENIIMERFTYIIMYGNFVVTNLRNDDLKYKPLRYSGARILKNVIFYVASAHFLQPIIE